MADVVDRSHGDWALAEACTADVAAHSGVLAAGLVAAGHVVRHSWEGNLHDDGPSDAEVTAVVVPGEVDVASHRAQVTAGMGQRAQA